MSIMRTIGEIHGLRQLPRAVYGVLAGTCCLTFFRGGFDLTSLCAGLSYAALAIISHAQPAPRPSLLDERGSPSRRALSLSREDESQLD